MFPEGHDAVGEEEFRGVARLTGGAWCRVDPGAAAQLRELLRAAAAYAAGGREALRQLSKTGSGAAKLLGQIKWSRYPPPPDPDLICLFEDDPPNRRLGFVPRQSRFPPLRDHALKRHGITWACFL